jgi:penicillin amidase
MRYFMGLVCVLALGAVAPVGCSESKQQEPDLEWPPDATAYFDEYGILSADCATDEDCAMVLGYYHAADRFVQMDLSRRFFTGRLTDLLDKAVAKAFGLVEIDVSNRTLFSTRNGVPLEQSLFDQASPKTIALLEAYSAGVNQWIDDLRNGKPGAVFPREFDNTLFVYGPENIPKWTPQDSLATFVGWTEENGNHGDLQVAAGVARTAIDNDAKFADLWSRRPIQNSATLSSDWTPPGPNPAAAAENEVSRALEQIVSDRRLDAGPALRRLHKRLQRTQALRRSMFGGAADAGRGSNAWAVGPSRSNSGHALIANDPHVSMTQPVLWYLAHLDAKTHGRGQIHAAGATGAGMPWIMDGHNEGIAWTGTTAYYDQSDVYIEELVKDAEGNPTGVMFQGQEVPFTRVSYAVTFVDGETEEHELLFVPHHGPVREIDVDSNVAITLRWVTHDATTDPEYGYALNTAANVDEARVALENVTAWHECRVVADTEGNIAWFPYTRVPKRTWATNLDGTAPPWLPLDGTGAYEWTEDFGYSELPQLLNPEQGFIATANNDMTGSLSDGDPTTLPSGESYPPYQVEPVAGYRHARIVELIEEIGSEHDLETMQRIQHDAYSPIGKDMIPGIVEIAEHEQTDLSPEAGKVVNALKTWKFSCPTGLDGLYTDSPLTTDAAELLEASGCAAFHATLLELCGRIDRNEQARGGCPSFAAFYSIVDPEQLAAGDIYWDDPATPETEIKYEVMAEALETVYDLFVNEKGLGTDEKKWAWGSVHGLVLNSQLAAYGAFEYDNPLPGEPLYANPGGSHTVAAAWPRRDLTQRSGVSFRLVCEMDPNRPNCTVQLAGGQSSHVDSPNYGDLLLKLLKNEPIDLVFDIDEAKANAVRTVTFE